MELSLQNFSYLDDLLQRVGQKLQLDDTRLEKAEISYKSVAQWIEDDEKFFDKFKIDIYSQGSFRLNTNIKPITGNEFDLDFVLQINHDLSEFDPNFVLGQLLRRLKEHGTYKNMVVTHKRGVRVSYSNEFHMDIMPAYLQFPDSNFIKIPAKELSQWIDRNPEDYAKWFEKQYLNQPLILEKAARIQELPNNVPYKALQPLQRVVQLIKRYRDIYFKDEDEKYKPKSIILTTLAAKHYQFNQSENLAIKSTLSGISSVIAENNFEPFKINNPARITENFSDKWFNNTKIFEKFVVFINDFNSDWIKMENAIGMNEKLKFLNKFFDESISKTALNEQGEFIKNLKDSKNIHMDKTFGTLTPFPSNNTIEHPRNDYFGE